MTEPDEALIWAREDAAAEWEKDGFSDLASKCRSGKYDPSLARDAYAYRAGQAAAAERIKALEEALSDLLVAVTYTAPPSQRRPAVNPSWLILHIVDALRVPSPSPHPADGYCSDALAYGLGVAAVVAFLAILAWAIIS